VVYFVATSNDTSGPQLWRTDGTPAGTQLVKKIGNDRAYGVTSERLVIVGDELYFVAIDADGGRELWRSDGTAAGTLRALDLRAGPPSSDPRDLLAVGGTLYFTADDGTGRALWRLAADPTVLKGRTLYLTGTDPSATGSGGDAFAVEAQADTLVASVNGAAERFAMSDVDEVVVNGWGGDDALTVAGALTQGVVYHAGSGNESFSLAGTTKDDAVTIGDGSVSGLSRPFKYSGIDHLAVATGEGTDTVDQVAGDGAVAVSTGAGPDVVTVGGGSEGLGGLRGGAALDLGGGGDFDVAVVDDHATAEGHTSLLRDAFAARDDLPQVTVRGADALTLESGSGADTVRVTPSPVSTFRVHGNEPAPPNDARDRLTLDLQGATSARQVPAAAGEGTWTFADRLSVSYTGFEETDDGVPLRADVVDVDPDPRRTPVEQVRVAFTEPVTGVDVSDFRLTRDGGPNLLADGQTVTSDDGVTWTLGNLAGLTAGDGHYVLGLVAAGSKITDAAGSTFPEDASDAFVVDTAAPTVQMYLSRPPGDTTTPVYVVGISFSEPVSGLGLADLSLSRDGGPNLLSEMQLLRQDFRDPRTFMLENAFSVLRYAGDYALSVTGDVRDAAGNRVAGTPTFAWRTDAAVWDERLFYNNSALDGNDPAPTPADQDAVAADKVPLWYPGTTSTSDNVSNYSRGINGIILNVGNLPEHAAPTAADFRLKAGTGDDPAGWRELSPSVITGVLFRRAEPWDTAPEWLLLTLADGAVKNTLLQVTVPGSPDVPLAASLVFYYGNLAGDAGALPNQQPIYTNVVNAVDVLRVRRAMAGAPPPLTGTVDFNRDGRVNALDLMVARNNLGRSLRPFTVPALPLPPAPAGAPAVRERDRAVSLLDEPAQP
jgi:ELWxxDGT repeat protein